jgi:putative oxidoreductase
MKYPLQSDDAGKLVLRLTVGILILFHGVAKLLNFSTATAGITKQVLAMGLPDFVAYGVFVGEVVAPVLLILGIFARLGGLLVVANMIFALVLVHTSQLLMLSKQGGWLLELQGFYLLGGLAIYFLGSGRFAVRPD